MGPTKSKKVLRSFLITQIPRVLNKSIRLIKPCKNNSCCDNACPILPSPRKICATNFHEHDFRRVNRETAHSVFYSTPLREASPFAWRSPCRWSAHQPRWAPNCPVQQDSQRGSQPPRRDWGTRDTKNGQQDRMSDQAVSLLILIEGFYILLSLRLREERRN